MNRTSNRSGHRIVARLITASASALGMIAIGYVVVTAAEHALPQPNAVTAQILTGLQTNVVPATKVPEPRLSTNASPASEARDNEREQTEDPRACQSDAGIVTKCVFN